jgi:hypothetical protein
LFFLIRGKKIKQAFFVLILAVSIIGVYTSFFKNATPQQSVIPIYQQIAPDIIQAPYVVTTPSRIYYVSRFVDDGRMVTLTKFYEYNKKKWQEGKLPLPLDRNTTAINIIQR